MTQGIRHSQFIYTYGPGSILEGENGPRIVLTPQRGLFYPDSPYLIRIDKYRLDDERMSKGLLDGGKIFRLPSNTEEQLDHNEAIYKTNPFPLWKLCLNFNRHTPNEYILYKGISCPSCQYSRAQQEAIRFVTACPDGHLDEIDWDYLAHRNPDGSKTDCDESRIDSIQSSMRRDCFVYYRGDGTIATIRIGCPRCNRQPTNFLDVYSGSLRCSSRFPEREPYGNLTPQRRFNSCQRRMRIIQRQSSSLRVVDVKTLLSIKSATTSLQVVLRDSGIRSSLVTLKNANALPANKGAMENNLAGLVGGDVISQTRMDEILRYEWDEIDEAIKKSIEPVPDLTYPELILDEFQELMKGSGDEGIPPISSPRPKSQVLFEMNPNLRMRVDGLNGRKFRICPVSKLATLTVQIGYRREISEPASEGIQNAASSLVRFNTRLPDALGKQSFWYPGIRNLGEGLFIRFDEDGGWHPKMKGDSSKEWMDTYSDTNQEVYDSSLFRSGNNIPREELHPVFVWWHILAHTLIRTISEEAGYSSASIQERVYLESIGDKVRGGILLYATQPGSEGSLGGLISLAPYFESMLEIALGQLQTCSGDPLCLEDHFKNKKLNGSACYGCVMNSETSCEFRNMWLDRHVLLDNMP